MDKQNKIKYFLKIKFTLFFIVISLLLLMQPCIARIYENSTNFNVIDNKIEVSSQRYYYSRWPKPLDKWSISFPSIKGQNKLLGPTSEVNGKVYFTYLSYIFK